MKNVLITGGAGYIGSKITNDFIKKKFNVVVVDDLSSGYKSLLNKKAKFVKQNIFYKKKLKKVIIENNIQIIVHCAASIDVSEGEKNKKKYFNNNVRNTEYLLQSLKGTKVKYLIFSSTCAVYGGSSNIVSEKSKLKPENYYGKTKYMGEELIKKYSKKYNFKYVLLRYFNVAGSDLKNKIGCIKDTNSLFKNLCLNVKKKKFEVNIYGNNYNTKDGTCIRDFIHLNDISRLHLLSLKKLIKSENSEIYNCGYGRGFTVLEVVRKFEKILKKNFKVNILSRRKGDIPVLYANNDKIKNYLNFIIPSKSLENIIRSSINWEKINNN